MNVFKLALPGHDAKDANLKDETVDSAYPSPKVNTVASPPHAGIIFLNWQTTTPIPGNTVKTIYSFPHGYNQVPTALAAFTYDNGTNKAKGILPFQSGALYLITIDADSTNVNLNYISFDLASTPIPAFVMVIRFYVFAERGLE